MPDRWLSDRPVQDPAGRPRGRGRGHPGRLSPARPEIPPGPRHVARRRGPDGRHQRRLGADRRAGEACRRSTASARRSDDARASAGRHRSRAAGDGQRRLGGRRTRPAPPRSPSRGGGRAGPTPPARDRLARLDLGPFVGRQRLRRLDARRRRLRGRRARHPAGRRAPSSTSVAMRAGRWARSPGSDLEYVEWLDRAPIGRNYRQEIDEILRGAVAASRPRRRRPIAEGSSAAARRSRRRVAGRGARSRRLQSAGSRVVGPRRSSGRRPARPSCPGPAA